MRIRQLLVAAVAAVVTVGLTPASALASPAAATPSADVARSGTPAARVVTTFPRGSFAESVVVDRHGVLYVSLTTWRSSGLNSGQVWKVLPGGRKQTFGPALDVGVLTGLALDPAGRLYAGVASWTQPGSPPVASGVVRIDATSVTRVLTLPTGPQATSSFPNGLVFRGRDLYVSDSTRGAVWRTTPRGSVVDVQSRPWLSSGLLRPSTAGAIGVNGLAVSGGHLYGVVSDTGRLVRVDTGRNGRPVLRVVTRSASLVHADGVTVDRYGRLWITTNGGDVPRTGSLVRADVTGRLALIARNASWMDYPTQAAFGTTGSSRSFLYVTNGAFSSEGSSTVVAVRVGSGPQR